MGDLLAILDAGAYGAAMASNYNRRPLPAEVLVDEGRWRVIRRRQTVDDLLALEQLMTGVLIAFEGLDQSGKQTQAELLRDRLKADGHKSRLVSFPDYGTSIGEEIARALQGEREYGPDVMQLLYVANRYERKPDLQRWLDGGLILVSDRYQASSVAYGAAFGLDAAWLTEMQRFLPAAALTILLDISPETAVQRKSVDRDAFERDLALLGRVRDAYQTLAADPSWVRIDGERSKEAIAVDVFTAVISRLALP